MSNMYGRQVVLPLTNKSGGGVIAGDVVIIDTGNDAAFTTTTSAAFTGGVGVAQETIANNDTGRVLIAGYAALVNTTASVTRGQFGTTSTTVKKAVGTASRGAGTFAQWLTGGTTPTARIFSPDLAAAAGNVAADAIFDAKGDIPAGTGPDAAAKVPVGTNGYHLIADSAQSTGLAWAKPATFKRTVLSGGGNITTTSTSKTPIDATNLAYLTLTLAVGDIVRCTLMGQAYTSTTGVAGFDFEVDQPVSANVYIGAGNDYGVTVISGAGARQLANATGLFIATEAGVHGFRPVWLVNGATETLTNASSGIDDTLIQFLVENLGPSS